VVFRDPPLCSAKDVVFRDPPLCRSAKDRPPLSPPRFLMAYANPDGTRHGKEERRPDFVATVEETLRVSDIADDSTGAILR